MVDNLRVITSGNPHPNPVNIFRSDFFDSWIDQMKGQGDWVLFDSPPPNMYSDSIALAGKVDGVVLVVQAEKTRVKVIQNTRDLLENGGGNILGVVLNKRHFHIPDWLYKTL
jgi:Mrp family chromosome partitioning ATPase